MWQCSVLQCVAECGSVWHRVFGTTRLAATHSETENATHSATDTAAHSAADTTTQLTCQQGTNLADKAVDADHQAIYVCVFACVCVCHQVVAYDPSGV